MALGHFLSLVGSFSGKGLSGITDTTALALLWLSPEGAALCWRLAAAANRSLAKPSDAHQSPAIPSRMRLPSLSVSQTPSARVMMRAPFCVSRDLG